MLNFVATSFMSRQRAIALRAKLPLVSEDSPKTWVEAAYVGKWDGHPSGSFEFTKEVFAQIIANFDRQKNPVPLTYEHPEHSGDGQPIPAAGWVLDLKIEGESLMALVEFTPRAAQMVKDGEYRFSSVVIDFEGIDRESGKNIGPELFELAITNTPFLDGQREIKLSRRVSAERSQHMSDSELIKAALEELGDKATTASVSQWVEGRKMQLAAVDGKQDKSKAEATDEPATDVAASAVVNAEDMPEPDGAEGAAAEAEGEASAALAVVQMLAEGAGLDEAAVLSGLEEQAEAVIGLLAGAPEDGTDAEAEAEFSKILANGKDAKIATLSRRIAELEAVEQERAEAERVKQIDAAIKCGDVRGADRDKLIKLAKDAPHLLADFTKSERPAVPTAPMYRAARVAPAPMSGESETVNTDDLTEAQQWHFKCAVNAGVSKPKAYQLARKNGSESAN